VFPFLQRRDRELDDSFDSLPRSPERATAMICVPVSVRNPSRTKTTERDANSASVIPVSTYGFSKRECCYEEVPSRGALRSGADFPTPQLTRDAERITSRRRSFLRTIPPVFARLGSVSGPLLCPDETYQYPTCTRLLSRQGSRFRGQTLLPSVSPTRRRVSSTPRPLPLDLAHFGTIWHKKTTLSLRPEPSYVERCQRKFLRQLTL